MERRRNRKPRSSSFSPSPRVPRDAVLLRLPCPWCGSRKMLVWERGAWVFVMCPRCGVTAQVNGRQLWRVARRWRVSPFRVLKRILEL